jgi:hypothetical protein
MQVGWLEDHATCPETASAACSSATGPRWKAERRNLISLLKKLGITADGILAPDRNQGR